ncbi:uncharacterized protein LOC130447501 [Diorhabda sublineata]|uniref:uncharacterized protein LOC130447501 n=1 Tax=Diorhabda sublineata TaxID=1163346 RepID=UPI0024E0A656|nr:uncharacterized protein LOC130447501 [Diorhabda sublineata]
MSFEIVNKIGTGDCEILEKIKDEDTAITIASDIVTDIINNALDIAEERGNIGDILEEEFEEETSKDKRKVTENAAGPFQGVGDQLGDDVNKEPKIQHRPVEKKSRLTDLVKNSKQLLAKLMLNESRGELHDTKSEKLVKVVELDSKEQPYRVKNVNAPEDTRLPSDDSDEILNERSGDEEILDEIQLSVSQGDDLQSKESLKKTMTFPLAGPSKKTLMDRYRTLKFAGEFKKKQWNFGSRIMDYIRKQKAKRQIENTNQNDEFKF